MKSFKVFAKNYEDKKKFVNHLNNLIEDLDQGDSVQLTSLSQNGRSFTEVITNDPFFKEGLVDYLKVYLGTQILLLKADKEKLRKLNEAMDEVFNNLQE